MGDEDGSAEMLEGGQTDTLDTDKATHFAQVTLDSYSRFSRKRLRLHQPLSLAVYLNWVL